jgi:hypothetical protein
MVSNHSRKNRAHRARTTTGAGHASASAGTAHHHEGPDLGVAEGRGFGADGRSADMGVASALIGACLDSCKPCQASLTARVLAGERLVIANLAGVAFGVVPGVSPFYSPTTRAFVPLARDSMREGGAAVLAMVDRLGPLELEDLLEDTLDMWAGIASPPKADSVPPPRTHPQDSADDEPQDPEEETRRLTAAGWGCAYITSAGMDTYITDDEARALIQRTDAGASAGTDPIVCHLCDRPIEVLDEKEIHLGLTTLAAPNDNVMMPVWTHAGCGRARNWAWTALAAERHRRGLPVNPGHFPTAEPQGDRAGIGNDVLFSLAKLPGLGVCPMVVIQPGEPHEHGTDGHLADMLSIGLKPVDLSGKQPPAELPFQARMDAGRLASITRSGAGTWWEQSGGAATPGDWRKAARAKRVVLLVVVPAGSLKDTETDSRPALVRAASAGHVLGGLAQVRGSLS